MPDMTTYRINIENTGDSFVCREDEPVLTAMITLGHRGIPVGCQGGGCGVCKVQVTRGDFYCRKMSRAHVSLAEESNGFALACQLIPESGLTLRVGGSLEKSILKGKNKAVTDHWRSVTCKKTKHEDEH